jgi:hypothetical protein
MTYHAEPNPAAATTFDHLVVRLEQPAFTRTASSLANQAELYSYTMCQNALAFPC